MLKKLMLTAGSLLIMTATAEAASPADTMHIELSTGGTITIEMLQELMADPSAETRRKAIASIESFESDDTLRLLNAHQDSDQSIIQLPDVP